MEFLYLRCLSGTTDPHLLRGIETVRKTTNGTKRTTHRLEPSYKDRRSCDHVSPSDLQNGQWWPLQIAAMRDGAHGEIEAGIHGKPEKDAFSVRILRELKAKDRCLSSMKVAVAVRAIALERAAP